MRRQSRGCAPLIPATELVGAGILRTIEDLSVCLGLSASELAKGSRRIPLAGYDPLEIVTNGKRRVIHRPRPWLKSLQRALHDDVLIRIPISDAVYSQRGRGVIANAKEHLARPYMVTLDIQDCFPSTRVPMVRAAWRRAGFDEPAIALLTRIVTYQDMLPQGPPSSPGVLNLVLDSMDEALLALAVAFSTTYTRYMDDLCFSCESPLDELRREATRIVRAHGFRINERKVRVWGPTDPHTVTKIVVTTTLNPEPEYLAALAREIALTSAGRGRLRDNQIEGQIAWIVALNPALGRTLRGTWRRNKPGRQLIA